MGRSIGSQLRMRIMNRVSSSNIQKDFGCFRLKTNFGHYLLRIVEYSINSTKVIPWIQYIR